MSDFPILATGRRRHKEKDRWLANALRHESVQLCRQLHFLSLQQQREVARVRWAQLELKKTLDCLKDHRPLKCHSLTQPAISQSYLSPRLYGHPPMQSCCPNHIVCSSCNLRLRLADTFTHHFTPALWTMYCHPLPTTCPGHTQDSVYHIPSFMERRKLSTMDNSLRYLPFL